jgi:hypothetical protein
MVQVNFLLPSILLYILEKRSQTEDDGDTMELRHEYVSLLFSNHLETSFLQLYVCDFFLLCTAKRTQTV